MRVGGIVLCGGDSRRMGRAKAWLPFGDELMLHRVVRLLARTVQPVVVAAGPADELPPLPDGVLTARDELPGRGPLQGIATGLTALVGRVEAGFVCSCDLPLLAPAFVARMIELLGDHQIAVPVAEGRHHVLAAVYRLNVLNTVQDLLGQDRLRVTELLAMVKTRRISHEQLRNVDPELRSLRNVNVAADYRAALAEAGLAQGDTGGALLADGDLR